MLAVASVAISPLSSAAGRPLLLQTADPGDNLLYTQLKGQTESFTDASSRHDQTAMGRLLDDDVLFSGGNGSVDRDPARDKNDALSTLLKGQTQAFRNAGQRGDVAEMKRYLDDNVIFINEDGVLSWYADFGGVAAAAPPGAISSTVTVTDWVLHYSGDVAVSSFINDQVVHYGGQVLNFKFLSVETWIEHGEAWKLLASHTIPLHQDPSGVTLSADQLNEYAGSYSIAPGHAVTVVRDGDALRRISDAGNDLLHAEVRDIFFVPGSPSGYARRRIIFHRDVSGRVSNTRQRASCSQEPRVPASRTETRFRRHRRRDVSYSGALSFTGLAMSPLPHSSTIETPTTMGD
jgi:hypothetical protein